MPNVNRTISPFIGGSGNPDTYVELNPYAPGDLGTAYDYNDKTYQRVVCDSGATSATPTGLVAANQLAFWKDRANYVVTNDSRMALFNNVADSFRNNVAGVFRSAVPPGASCFVLIRGRNIPVKASAGTAGQLMTANTGTAADASGTAIGTAPQYEVLGVAIGSVASGNVATDFDIPNIP
jgi:hypothetical protein